MVTLSIIAFERLLNGNICPQLVSISKCCDYATELPLHPVAYDSSAVWCVPVLNNVSDSIAHLLLYPSGGTPRITGSTNQGR